MGLKTYRNLYSKVTGWDNLYLAYRKARKGKRGRPPAASFEYDLEANLVALHRDLVERTYQPGNYNSFYIHEPKRRLISAAPFRDRVVHHALCNVIGPIFERGFIFDSYANRIGKGTHRALDRAQHYARRFRYVLPLDVRQFFPSIDHTILRSILARKVADGHVLWLIDRILESGVGVLSEEYHMQWFPGDDLFAASRPRGLPIGNLTSQFWANCYLNPLDHFLKRELKRPAYLRYVDDLLLFSDDKRQLRDWCAACVEKLASLRLTLHENSAHARPVAEGFPFLGFVIFPTHRRLERRKVIHYRRHLKELLRDYRSDSLPAESVAASTKGWINHARYGDTWGLRRAILSHVTL
jgi:RNA-directed DNA polymerase